MPPIAPDSTQPLHLARHAVINAAEKLQDVATLLAGARWSSAYALSALALEEIGKAMLCVTAFSNPESAMQLTKDLKSHQVKLEAAVGLVLTVNGTNDESAMRLLERAVALVPQIHGLRMRGLYVDSPDFDTFRTPADVTEDDAKTLADYLRTAVDAVRALTHDEAADRLTELATQHAAPFREATGLGQQLVGVAPDEAMNLARRMLRGELPTEPDDPPVTSE